jgi:hypothetical protein
VAEEVVVVLEEEVSVAEVISSSRSRARSRKLTVAGRGGSSNFTQSYGPPAQVLGKGYAVVASIRMLILPEMGTFLHATEGEMVCESINTKIPYFNAPIYLENKVGYSKSIPETLADICRHQSGRWTRSWDPSTKFTSPSSRKRAYKLHLSSPETNSTSEETSYCH